MPSKVFLIEKPKTDYLVCHHIAHRLCRRPSYRPVTKSTIKFEISMTDSGWKRRVTILVQKNKSFALTGWDFSQVKKRKLKSFGYF